MPLFVREITCDNCNKKVKELPFQLKWVYNKKTCKNCGDIKEGAIFFEFCSSRCLKNWARKFHNHQHKWTIHPINSGATLKDGKPDKVWAYCSICKKTAWRKDKRLLQEYFQQHKSYLETIAKIDCYKPPSKAKKNGK